MADKTRHVGFYVDEDFRSRLNHPEYGIPDGTLSTLLRTMLEKAMDAAEETQDSLLYYRLADGKFNFDFDE